MPVSDELIRKVASMKGLAVTAVGASDETAVKGEDGSFPVLVAFEANASVRADCWRWVNPRRNPVSGFEHGVQYGLPEPLDAVGTVRGELVGESVVRAGIDRFSGDLVFEFSLGRRLEVFNFFTGYETWELRFPDGTAEYSNYALR